MAFLYIIRIIMLEIIFDQSLTFVYISFHKLCIFIKTDNSPQGLFS